MELRAGPQPKFRVVLKKKECSTRFVLTRDQRACEWWFVENSETKRRSSFGIEQLLEESKKTLAENRQKSASGGTAQMRAAEAPSKATSASVVTQLTTPLSLLGGLSPARLTPSASSPNYGEKTKGVGQKKYIYFTV